MLYSLILVGFGFVCGAMRVADMINICLCDDDKCCVAVCKSHIEEYAKNNNIDINIVEFSSGGELLFSSEGNENYFQVMFLDIIMSGKDGVETAKELRKRGYKGLTIFLTASSDYALKSFEAEPYNYVLKQEISGERFQRLLEQVFSAVQDNSQKKLIISTSRSSVVIELDDIIYIESSLKKILLHTSEGITEAVYTMDDAIKKVEQYGFIRCHKSFVVNSRYVKAYNKSEIALANGESVPIGRAYIGEFTKGFLELAKKNVLLNRLKE